MNCLKKYIALYAFISVFCAPRTYSMPEENDRDDIPFFALPERVHQLKAHKELKDVKELKDAKELKDRKERGDVASQLFFTPDRDFVLEKEKDGTETIFKVFNTGFRQAIPAHKINVDDDDFPGTVHYTFDQPVITKAYSVTFAPEGNIIAVVSGRVNKLVFYLDKLSYEEKDESYLIQLYRIDPATRKVTLIQEKPYSNEFRNDQRLKKLSYQPDGKKAYLWRPGESKVFTCFYVNPDGTLFWMHSTSEAEDIPAALAFSPDGKSTAIAYSGAEDINGIDVSNFKVFDSSQGYALPLTVKMKFLPGEMFARDVASYEATQNISLGTAYPAAIAYSQDSRLAGVALAQEAEAASTQKVGSGGSGGAQAPIDNTQSKGKILFYEVVGGKFTKAPIFSIDLDFEPIAIAFSPRFAQEFIVAGNNSSGGVIKRYGKLNNGWKEWAKSTLPGQNITSLAFAPNNEQIAITTEQGTIEILDTRFLHAIDTLAKEAFGTIEAPGVEGPVSYSPNPVFNNKRAYGFAAAITYGAVSLYEVDPIRGGFILITNDLVAYERQHRPQHAIFGPDTQVMSIPNDMGGFSIVPRTEENERIAAEFQAKKATAINHIISEWEKELDDLAVEDRIDILKKWAKIAREKQWSATAKDSAERFKRQLREAREAFEREAAIADDEINEAEIERELDDLEKIKL